MAFRNEDEVDSSSFSSSDISSESGTEPRQENDGIVEIQLAATSAVNNGALLRCSVIFCVRIRLRSFLFSSHQLSPFQVPIGWYHGDGPYLRDPRHTTRSIVSACRE